jgi:triacylglycerol lipase
MVYSWSDLFLLIQQDTPFLLLCSYTRSKHNSISSWLNEDTQIYVTGHSLGAALATLAALHIDKLIKSKGLAIPVHLYTFASPRVGDRTFASHFGAIDAYRIINSEDLIQSVPLPTTRIFDEPTLKGMEPVKQQRVTLLRGLLELITKGQSEQQYQHVGLPITFTHQTGTIAGNHNHTKTYRQALKHEQEQNILP